MFKRGLCFYTRLRGHYGDRWISLGRDRDEACRKFREIRRGKAPAGRVSVEEAAGQWLEGYVRTQRNERGAELAGRRVAMYLVPYFQYRPLASVTAEDLRHYRLHLERQSLAPQSVAHLLSDARCFFNWCESAGLVERSPVPKKLLPRIPERPPDRLTDEEVEAVLKVPEPYAFVVRLALGTGLRWGELVRAQASDVENSMLVVHHTKSGKLRRVPLAPELLAEVRQRVGRLVPMRNSTGFTRQVRRYSGVRRFHPHQLRHTFACRWLERGGNLAALQLILGHSSIVTTQRYARLTDDHVRAEAERIGGNSVAESVAVRPRRLAENGVTC
jgi:integrase